MKVFLYSIILIILIIIIYIFNHQNNTKYNTKRQLITELVPLECDLNKSDCYFDFDDKKVLVSFVSKPLIAMDENTLKIKNLGDFKKLNAKIYGLNMYMGDIVPTFIKNDDNYEAKIRLSSCATKTMRYRIEFFDDNKAIDFYFDFDLIQ